MKKDKTVSNSFEIKFSFLEAYLKTIEEIEKDIILSSINKKEKTVLSIRNDKRPLFEIFPKKESLFENFPNDITILDLIEFKNEINLKLKIFNNKEDILTDLETNSYYYQIIHQHFSYVFELIRNSLINEEEKEINGVSSVIPYYSPMFKYFSSDISYQSLILYFDFLEELELQSEME